MVSIMEDKGHRTSHENARYCIVNPPLVMIRTAVLLTMLLRSILIRFSEVSLS